MKTNNSKRKIAAGVTGSALAVLMLGAGLFSTNGVNAAEQDSYAKQNGHLNKYTSNLPFNMPKVSVPHIANKKFDIRDYGAVKGLKDSATAAANAKAINAAISAASKAGGGIVVIPAGMWQTGPIVLQSNVNLHLDTAALVDFTDDHSQYPVIPSGSKYVVQSPISANGATNIAITGKGILDGNGNTWRPVKQYKLSVKQWNGLLASGGVATGTDGNQIWYPSQEGANGDAYVKSHPNMTQQDYENIKDYYPPTMVSIQDSENILLDGVTFKNSPYHTVKIEKSKNIVVQGTKIDNPWYSQNSDGYDIASDNTVLIVNNTINTGDDGIAMDSSPDGSGKETLQNVVVENNHVYYGHGGFTVGSSTSGGIKNIYVHNNTYDGTVYGLRFKGKQGNGGLVHDIWIDGISMKDIQDTAIIFDDGYVNNQASGTSSSTSTPGTEPQFQDIHISNVDVDYSGNLAMEFNGLPDAPIQNIDLNNVNITAKNGTLVQNANNIQQKNVNIQTGANELGFVLHE